LQKPEKNAQPTISIVHLPTIVVVDVYKTNIMRATDAELEILNILWTHGPSTVRSVHDILALKKDAGYTTTLKQMQCMLEKGLLSREETGKAHVYTAVANQQVAQGQIVQRMVDSFFNGSAMQLVMQALGSHQASEKELEMIREYLDKKTKE
jgi:BlaI family transcriptional regulator, penicillinase repressor